MERITSCERCIVKKKALAGSCYIDSSLNELPAAVERNAITQRCVERDECRWAVSEITRNRNGRDGTTYSNKKL